MGAVTPNRLRWGALAWLLTLQFFVVETVAELRHGSAYSRIDDVISALGASDSPAAMLMNASFVLQGALILAGALLLRPVLMRTAGEVAPVLLGGAAAGVLLVGVFPIDGNGALHAIGAVLYLLGGGLGLIALAYAVRPRSEALGTTLALLGLVGTATSVFFLTGVVGYLGEGGTERAAAYVLPIGLAVAAVVLWRQGPEPVTDAPVPGDGVGRREERARERQRRAQQARERDAALDAFARRHTDTTADDDEDLWSPPGRNRD
ncbi:DUF998 domain-containing protein [Blastococcus sp. PRF04-17]|uniref:DUF998 domain-containing protein n=1 Tax=Blastococcus sp. PRF04-17 TaxID=2933797 RepID=UPI001FF5242C|nr:DUF998 domain-containing protein [Blastococcus sp. PRF04-17]UOY02724.1 DUF998 domain-containing protein [Blastococcus sp. PRF04-17]